MQFFLITVVVFFITNWASYFDSQEISEKCQRFFIFCCLFVCFVALRPKSTAMVMAGRSVNLTTLFPGQA